MKKYIYCIRLTIFMLCLFMQVRAMHRQMPDTLLKKVAVISAGVAVLDTALLIAHAQSNNCVGQCGGYAWTAYWATLTSAFALYRYYNPNSRPIVLPYVPAADLVPRKQTVLAQLCAKVPRTA